MSTGISDSRKIKHINRLRQNKEQMVQTSETGIFDLTV